MKLFWNVAPLLLLIFACKVCNFTAPATDLNPFRGSLEQLLPKEGSLDTLKFKQTSLRHIIFRGAQDTVEADYTSSAGSIMVPIQLKVANYPSSQAADAAIRTALGQTGSTLESKKKGGQAVGQRFVDANGKAVVWTNGSLLCIASSQFPKATSNMEEVLPF